MIKKIILNLKNKFMSESKKNSLLLEDILNKSLEQNTIISGCSGAGKSFFLRLFINKLYTAKKNFLFKFGYSYEIKEYLPNNIKNENIFIFLPDYDKTHTIDIDFLLSNEKIFNELFKLDYFEKTNLKNRNMDWLSFFNNPMNEKYLINNNFYFIQQLIKDGYLIKNGNLNKDIIENKHFMIYLISDEMEYYKSNKLENLNYLENLLKIILKDKNCKYIADNYSIKNNITNSINFSNYIITTQNKYDDFLNHSNSEQILVFRQSEPSLNFLTFHTLSIGEFYHFYINAEVKQNNDKLIPRINDKKIIVTHLDIVDFSKEEFFEILNNKTLNMYNHLNDELKNKEIKPTQIKKNKI